MRVYSYIVRYDFGFAPNPFHGVCTLATCKPEIRRAAQVGDWIAGTGAKSNKLAGRLVYAMRVGSSLTYDQYWNDERFAIKRPVLNGSLKLLYGDNIYHHDSPGHWAQADSHHSRPGGVRHLENLKRDTRVDRVLIADHFVYFGAKAIEIPEKFRSYGTPPVDICIARQGHGVFGDPLASAFVEWVLTLPSGLVAFPAEHRSHPKTEHAGGPQ